MHHIMFDIDGTLVQSYDLDTECFIDSVKEVTGIDIDSDWSKYRHVTDVGILDEFLTTNRIPNKSDVQVKIKQGFIERLSHSIAKQPVQQIPGAADFLDYLATLNNVSVSLATGGWYESASMKLNSAGIDFSSIPFASSNDSYSRIEIMQIAARRAAKEDHHLCTYFGDGSWDKKACEELGFKFVLVGNGVKHSPKIGHFDPIADALACIGLEA